MPCPLTRKEYVAKYINQQLSEHFGKHNAVIFMTVILVGKFTKLLKKVSVLWIQVSVGREMMFLYVWNGFSVMWAAA